MTDKSNIPDSFDIDKHLADGKQKLDIRVANYLKKVNQLLKEKRNNA